MNEQGSQEWLAERLGKITASRIADLMSTTKSGYSTSRANYIAQLVCERLTGKVQESFTNGAMQWGTETEPLARATYEVTGNVMVDQVGFIQHPDIEMAGCSPDGLVGYVGMIEIKCPNTATHIDTLLSKKPPSKYILQMQFQMACTGRQWCDFVSFDPRLPEHLSMFVSRVHRDEEKIKTITEEVEKGLLEVAKIITDLQNL